MPKVTGSYETIIIFSLSKGEEAAKTLAEKFKALIEENGTIDEIDEWGKRRLAYLINDETEGFYVLYNFNSKPDFPAELKRVLGITEGVLRSSIIAK